MMIVFSEVKDSWQIEKVAELAYEIWNEHYVPIIGQKQVDYMVQQFQNIEAIRGQISEGYRYFLILYEDSYAGYFAIQPDVVGKSIFLSKLYINKNFRRLGIAKQSILYIESICKQTGFVKLWLTVNKYNTGSIEAYIKMGFINSESIEQDIGNGFVMDDYVMVKKI